MKFFTGTDGHHYRIDDIVSISRELEIETGRGKRKVHRVKMKAAEDAEIWAYDFDALTADEGSIIPAAAGTFVLHWDVHTHDADGLTKVVVIGWRISSDGSVVEAITADGVNDGLDSTPAVLMPDGTVVSPGLSQWPDLTAWSDEQVNAATPRGIDGA